MNNSKLADALLEIGCVRFGDFTLKSGLKSPIYVDLRRLVAAPEVLALVADAMIALLEKLAFDHIAALPYAAMPIGTAVSMRGGYPMIYPRKEVKEYGTKAQIEGVYEAGEKTAIIDDLISTGGSKLEGIEKLTGAGLIVEDIIVLIDRQSGGVDFMAEHGYNLHAVFTLPELLDYWEEKGSVEAEQIAAARLFLKS
jgi:uridine monophosphate synthetase